MRFSLEWLRTHVPAPESSAEIGRRLTSVGLAVEAFEQVGEDTAIDVDVTTNRPDCMNHRGLAREIAAAFDRPLHPLALDFAESTLPVGDAVSVTIEAGDLCPRYLARVIRGARADVSPAWLQKRLHTIGIGSKSNIVDASNYVLFDLGHPLHAFDLARIAGPSIVVRRARAGERLLTVADGLDHALSPEMLVIADAARPVAIAGVMGGRDCGIGDATTDILVESAWFDPLSVRRAARALGMHSDASHRFERGADPDALVIAARSLCRLILELAGGECLAGEVDVVAREQPRRRTRLRHARLEAVLGAQVAPREVERRLAALEIPARREESPDGPVWEAALPGHRGDLAIEEDLIEEVARSIGYDAIPSTLPTSSVLPPERLAGFDAETAVRERLASLGYFETIGYAMVGREEDAAFAPVGAAPALKIANPLSERWEVMRRSILPGLVRAASHNFRHGQRDFALFEIGTIFLPDRSGNSGASRGPDEAGTPPLPREDRVAGLIAHGRISGDRWSVPKRPADVWDMTGALEAVSALRPGAGPAFEPARFAFLQQGQSFRMLLDGKEIGFGGPLDAGLAARFDLPDGCVVAQADLAPFSSGTAGQPRFRSISRYPEIERDLSVTVPTTLPWARLSAAAASALAGTPASFVLADRYEGAPLPAGSASLTLRVRIAPEDRTWTQEEIDALVARLAEALTRDTGATRRI